LRIGTLEIKIDSERIDAISDHISSNPERLKRLLIGPEHTLPYNVEWGSYEHALFLAYTCVVDYSLQREADYLWLSSRLFFQDNLELLHPTNSASLGLSEFRRLFKKYFKGIFRAPANIDIQVQRMFSMASYLRKIPDCDPRKVYKVFAREKKDSNPNVFLRWLVDKKDDGLPGGEKVHRLWLRTMVEDQDLNFGKGMWPFTRQDLIVVPLPVDKNIISAGISLGLVKRTGGYFHDFFTFLNEVFECAWVTVAKKAGLIPFEIDEPIWKIGRYCRRKKCLYNCIFEGVCSRDRDFMFGGEVSKPGKSWDVIIWPSVRSK